MPNQPTNKSSSSRGLNQKTLGISPIDEEAQATFVLESFFFPSDNVSHITENSRANANLKNSGKIIIVVLEIPGKAG